MQEDMSSGRVRKAPESFLNRDGIKTVLSEAKNGRRDFIRSAFAAVAAGAESGGYASVSAAQNAMVGCGREYQPNPSNHQVYQKIYALYRQLHDAFGTRQGSAQLFPVMKELLEIRDTVRRSL